MLDTTSVFSRESDAMHNQDDVLLKAKQFADVDEDNLFTVYNTGTTGAQVQCLIFDDIDYVDFYDTLKTTQVVDVDDIKNIVVNE